SSGWVSNRENGIGTGDRADGIGDHHAVSACIGLLEVADEQVRGRAAADISTIRKPRAILGPCEGERGIPSRSHSKLEVLSWNADNVLGLGHNGGRGEDGQESPRAGNRAVGVGYYDLIIACIC